MGQIFSRHCGAILGLLFILAIDIHLAFIIKPHFNDAPNTKVWFCMAWMGILTEAGFGIIWYKIKED